MRNKRSTRIPYGILVLTIISLVSLTACGEPKVETIEISPEARTLKVGESVDFDAAAISNKGEKMDLPATAFEWSVEGDIGAIDNSGVFVAKKPGEGTVLARSAGLFDEAKVTVEPQPIARIEANPEAPGAFPGEAITLNIKGITQNGQPAAFAALTLNSSTEGVSLSDDAVSLNEVGEARVQVTLGPQSGENIVVIQSGDVSEKIILEGAKVSRIEIRPGDNQFIAGQTVDFDAFVHGKYGSRPEERISWSVTGEHAEIEGGGVVRMKSPGAGIVLAEYEGVTQGHPFTITPGRVASIKVSPESVELTAGENAKFTAEAFNAYGHPVRADVEWRAEGGLGAIAKDGVFLARKAGSGSIRALSGDVRGEAGVLVEHGPLAGIQIEMPDGKLMAGETVDLAAHGLDAYGNRFSIDPQWLLTSPVGTIDEKEGKFRALHTGRSEIRAKVGEVMGIAGVEVSPAQLAEIRILPKNADLVAGETLQFEVRGFDRFGNRVEIEPRFSASMPLGDLHESGFFSARKAGNAIVEARVGDFTDESAVAVKPAQMSEIVIKPEGPVELRAGAVQDFDAYGVDRFGNVVASSVRWTISPELGSIDEHGKLLPRRAGKAEVTASVTQLRMERSLQAEVSVAVEPGETVRIDLEPQSVTATAGEEVKFSAAAYDRFGNETEAPLRWSLRNPTVGSISANGLLIPVKAESTEVLAMLGNVVGVAQIQVEPAQVAFLRIVPDELHLKGGERAGLRAITEDRFGNMVDHEVVWSLSSDSLGEITPWNELIARKAGSGMLIAAARNIVDTAPLAVTAGPPVAMRLEPRDIVVKAGTDVPIEVKAFDAGGNPVDIEPEWSVAGELGRIGPTGILLTKRTGIVEVIATNGDMNQSVMIEVVPSDPASAELKTEAITASSGEAIPLSYEIFDAFGNAIPRPKLDWQAPNGLGYVTPDGYFHAKKAGEGVLRLVAGEAVAEIPVAVAPGPIHSIGIEPTGVKLRAGEKIEFSAAAYDREGNNVDFEPVWSLAGAIGSIDEKGAFLAERSGNGYVTVNSSDVTGIASIGVLPGPIVKVDVEPSGVSAKAGDAVQFKAVAYDAYGNMAPADFSWSMDAQRDLGRISDDGVAEVRRAGGGMVVASAGDVSGRADIDVEAGELAGVAILPRDIEAQAGERVDIVALGRDAYGNAVEIDPEFSVEPASLGYFTEDLFVAGMAGEGRLLASARGFTGTIPVKVEEGGLNYLQIDIPDAPLRAGKSYDLNAVGYDAGCNVVSAEPSWAVSEKVGKIDPSTGKLYVSNTGKGVVVAYSGGVASEKMIEVLPGELDRLFISPDRVDVKSGTPHEFEVYGFDTEGNRVELSRSAVKWSLEGRIGKLSDKGQFRGMAMGHGKVIASVDGKRAESSVVVTPGAPSPESSRVRVSHPMLPAVDNAYSEITVEVRDAYNNPVPGVDVTLVSNRSGDILIQPGKTDDRGQAVGRISSSEPGLSTIQAIMGENAIADSEQLNFG